MELEQRAWIRPQFSVYAGWNLPSSICPLVRIATLPGQVQACNGSELSGGTIARSCSEGHRRCRDLWFPAYDQTFQDVLDIIDSCWSARRATDARA
jgi:hypothetical protein